RLQRLSQRARLARVLRACPVRSDRSRAVAEVPCETMAVMGSLATRNVPWWALATSVAVFAVSIAYGAFAGASDGTMISQVVVSGTFVATGLIAWTRRPDNRMGPLMVLFGWCFMAIAFTKPAIPALVPVGLAGFVVSGSLLGYVMLAYPSGELRTTQHRPLIAACAIGIGAPRLVRLLATDAMPSGSTNTNPLWLLRDPDILAVTQP